MCEKQYDMCWLKSGAHHWITAPCRPIKNARWSNVRLEKKEEVEEEEKKKQRTTCEENDGERRALGKEAGRKQRCSLADNGRCECAIVCNV